jgi:uncharacterized SAM-binding protein YcdF (DUF218 family)
MNIILILLGIVFIAYDATLILINPGTFMDIVISFTHIWLAAGAYLIFLGIYRIKKGHSFWSIWKKWIKLTVISLLAVGAVIAIINLSFILRPEVVSINDKAENVILLGGGIDKDGRLPKSVVTRVEKAAEYLKANPDSLCVVTGGTLKWLPYAEAPELKNQLVNRGIAPERILVEDQAKDTIQNFQFSVRMLAEYRGQTTEEILNTPTAVVTSRFHLRRSERLARRLGFKNIKGIPAACPAIYVPHNYVREICAYVKLNLRILLTGKPERLSGQARQ